MINLLQTVAFLHDNGVVHRDLKPENLLLPSATNSTDIKLADFGFAKNVRDLNPKERPCGTFAYVPPEVILGKPFRCEVDIWSLGVIFYVLLVGYPPFPDDDLPTLFSRIKKGQYDFPQKHWGHVTPQAIDMIRKMLCVDQQTRWTAKQLLRHPWMMMDDKVLVQSNLTPTIEQLKKYRAHMRFRRVALAVVAAGKLLRSGKSLAARKSLDDFEEDEGFGALPTARSASGTGSGAGAGAGQWFPTMAMTGVVGKDMNSRIESALCQSVPADEEPAAGSGYVLPRGVSAVARTTRPLAPADVVVVLPHGAGEPAVPSPNAKGTAGAPAGQQMDRTVRFGGVTTPYPFSASESPAPTQPKKSLFNCC
jgi:hypothetical protein